MNEYTIIDTIQVTRIIQSDKEDTEQKCIEENGNNILTRLSDYDDAIVLDHKVFVRNVEDNSVDDTEDNVEEREE